MLGVWTWCEIERVIGSLVRVTCQPAGTSPAGQVNSLTLLRKGAQGLERLRHCVLFVSPGMRGNV
jgi:hypothetical protein